MSTPTTPPPSAQAIARPAVLHATIQVKRAATGLVETYQLIGTPVEEKENCHGSHAPDNRPQ